jgi:aminopeptidase N
MLQVTEFHALRNFVLISLLSLFFSSAKTLSYFTEYFSIPYPLPKLDMIAIADFAAGAME